MKPPGLPQEQRKKDTISAPEAIRKAVEKDPFAYFSASIEELIRKSHALSMEQLKEFSEVSKRLVKDALPKIYETLANEVAGAVENEFGIKVKVGNPEFNFMGTRRAIVIEFPRDFKYPMTEEGEYERKMKEQQRKFDIISSKFPNIKIEPGYGMGVADLESWYRWGILIPNLHT